MQNTLFISSLEIAGIGLAGVFAVLCLFFASIKILQKIDVKNDDNKQE